MKHSRLHLGGEVERLLGVRKVQGSFGEMDELGLGDQVVGSVLVVLESKASLETACERSSGSSADTHCESSPQRTHPSSTH